MTQPRGLLCLAVFVATLPLLPSRVAAQSGPTPSISVSVGTILSGDPVVVSGKGFPPNTPLMVWLDTNGNGQLDVGEPFLPFPVITDGSGALPITPWILTDVPAGLFSVSAGSCPSAPSVALCAGNISKPAQTPLTINLGLNHSSFGSGTTVTVTGFGFSASSPVNVWYDTDPAGPLAGAIASASPSADSNGAFSTPLVVRARQTSGVSIGGDYFIHAGASTPQYSIGVHIGDCWFQACTIDGAETICLVGNSPSDLQFAGISFADCKKVDSNYTNPTPITALNNPPGGYDLNNVGPVFLGAGVLAAAANELAGNELAPPFIVPQPSCLAMGNAIADAEGIFQNSVPNKLDGLLPIACVPTLTGHPIGLAEYIGGLEACLGGVGPCNHVPDKDLILTAVAALKAAAVSQPELLPLAQQVLAEAAVTGAIACGYVNYYCNGSDITKTILENPNLQQRRIPLVFFQPPIKSVPSPNPCAAVGVNGNCWGGLIGWSRATCKIPTSNYITVNNKKYGACEIPDINNPTSFPQLPVPGSAGSPHNSGAESRCAIGTVGGLSIGYDGDVSFDITGPDVFKNGLDGVSLGNYHNFLPGPDGSDPPDGLDIEIPLADRPLFMSTIQSLRPGMTVDVCGQWVADMHMLWNELHPVSSLKILVAPLTITAQRASRRYGQANPAFNVSYSGFVNGDTPAVLTGMLTCSSPATPASPVNGNPYPINCSGLSSSNNGTTYAPITYAPGLLTITPAPLSLTANDAARAYRQANPAFTGVVAGIQNGDNITAVYTSSATISSPVGRYSIAPTLVDPDSKLGNYSATVSNGTLTVNPAGAGANGTIVFLNLGSLATMNPDGTGLTTIATPPVRISYQDPAWSRDGKRIAFISGDPTGASTLNVMNAGGSGLTALTTSSSGFSHPTWSPDGKQIAVALQVGFFTTSIGVINADGGGGLRTLLSTSNAFFSEPAWSPDGTKIAVVEQDLVPGAGEHIALANADGTGLTPVTSGKFDTSPTWSPDGTLIAFVSSGQIYRINLDGTGLTKLSNGADNDSHPRWSPDGTRIVFGTALSGVDIWTMSAVDGVGRVPLTSCDCAISPDWQLLQLAVGNTPAGQNVIVTPVDTTTSTTPVTVTFNSVTQTGTTTLTTSSTGTPPPSGFEVGVPTVYYDISTTAVYTPPVTVCIHYNGTSFFGSPAPHMFHIENGLWVDRTTTIDTVNMIACGVAPSLSPFALFAAQPILTITANNASRQYGQANPVFTVSYSGFVNGDTPAALTGMPTCSSLATPSSPVNGSPYPINCSGLSSPNYVINYAPGQLTITAAPLTVTADNASRQYGQVNPAFTGVITGIQNSDNITANYTTTATPTSPVGTYPITDPLIDPNGRLPNYTVTVNNGTLTITPAPLTITANNQTKTYGQTVAFTGSEFTAAGLLNADKVTSVTLASAGAAATATVAGSPYPITPSSAAGAGLGNYNISYANGTLTVTPALLTITANNAAKILDAPNPSPLAWTATGFVNGENTSVLTTSPTCATTATTTSPVGSYPMTCSGASAANYTFSYVAGTLKIQYATAIGHVILPPINADGTSVVKQGRTIPAKFDVYDANGVPISTPGVVSSFFLTAIVSGTVTTTVEDVVDTNNPDTAFRWDGQEWIFNITTGNLSAGSTYIYTITLNDGSTIMFQYGLR